MTTKEEQRKARRREYMRQYMANNPQDRSSYNKDYYNKNKSQLREKQNAHAKTPEAKAKRNKRLASPEEKLKRAKYMKEYRARKKEEKK